MNYKNGQQNDFDYVYSVTCGTISRTNKTPLKLDANDAYSVCMRYYLCSMPLFAYQYIQFILLIVCYIEYVRESKDIEYHGLNSCKI